jgi:nucleotide-binding universal stress UspA family protein
MFKNILVCLDGSAYAEQILSYAKQEVMVPDTNLTLLRVVHIHLVYMDGAEFNATSAPDMPSQKTIDKDYDEAVSYLEGKAKLLREAGIKVKIAAIIGEPGETIINYAQKNGIDLIAIATHGHGGIKKVFFGSTAEQVIRYSSLPVLLVKPKQKR